MAKFQCDGKCLSRRAVVEGGARLGVGVAAVGLVAACGRDEESANGDPGAAVPVTAGVATFDFASYPALKTPGGSYRVSINGSPVSVTRISDGSAAAVLATCTHQGATLGDAAAGTFTCPRHGAKFSLDGTVQSGPAGSDLTTYPATIGATSITVKVG